MKREWAARAAALLLGLGLIAGTELALRVLGVGPAPEIFVRAGATYRLNARAAERFFPHQYARLAPGEQVFEAEKAPETLRVFVLGASTLLGFPNPPYASFTGFLRLMLEDLFPARQIEVLNCGITAINSFCLLDFVEEIADYSPDLIVLYAGHNEFIGPYGVTTPFLRLGNDRRLIRLHMELSRLRLYYVLSEGLYRLRGGYGEQGSFGLHLVQREVYAGSKEHAVAEENFRLNLREILQAAGRRQVPVLVSSLVSNLRGFYPLGSQGPHPETLPEQGGIAVYEDLLARFPQHAALHFQAGEALWEAGEYGRAGWAFARARDLDSIHLRACSPFNRIIREEASAGGALLVDGEAIFAAEAPHGVPGNELVAEYLHPTVFGHYLLARGMAGEIARHLGAGPVEDLPSFARYAERLGYSARDRVHYRNDLILFLRRMPYAQRPRVLAEALRELVELQLEEVLALSYAEIGAFWRRGGFVFLRECIEEFAPQVRAPLRQRLQEVAGPLGMSPYAGESNASP